MSTYISFLDNFLLLVIHKTLAIIGSSFLINIHTCESISYELLRNITMVVYQ
ncbi:MAG: hypothetical protein P857_996 [Candidatus Xenolissoclinum pacificiensis L6]|uniref:Uncharacterized protein n=1 Tax=Candidatus Xenolissoclinum pacificiensis L6 TaxID=1401685 RepID=W2V2Z3_9RICK|nr:MAG: hypothetical protein P857_996 [Candidatus Xenolissoclinum pacificiensis L6]